MRRVGETALVHRLVPRSTPLARGRRGAASLPECEIDKAQARDNLHRMEAPKRKKLPHEIPLWVDPNREVYFITINCRERGANQLDKPEVAEALFETVEFRQQNCTWWCYFLLLMPDHLHALMSFPDTGKRIQSRMSKWKEWTAKELGIGWQRDFFEHRLRREESFREKADYILANPVRKGLVTEPREWPFVWFAEGPRPYGWPDR